MFLNLKGRKYLLLWLCAVLIILNILVIQFTSMGTSRVIRLLSTFIFFAYFMNRQGFWKKSLLLAFVFFLFRDVFIIQYEVSLNKTASFIFTILSYGVLCLAIAPSLKLKKSTPALIGIGLVLVLLNIFNVYYLSDIVMAQLNNELQYNLFFIQGGMLLVLGIVGFLFNDLYEGKTSLYYLLMAFSFVLSDCFGLAAYYYGAEAAFFPERIFYLFALVLLVRFSLNTAEDKALGKAMKEREYLL